MKKRRRKRKKKVFETIKDALAHNFLLFLFQKKNQKNLSENKNIKKPSGEIYFNKVSHK